MKKDPVKPVKKDELTMSPLTTAATASPTPWPTTSPRLLEGRTALVTGGGRGLGRLFAATLAEAGAQLVLTGRDPGALAETAELLQARNTRVLAVPADVTDPAAMPKVVEEAVDSFGTIDVLVNNAGATGPIGPFWELDRDEWQDTVDVNLMGTVRTCHAVLPVMTARCAGRVINITSEAGRHRWPHLSAYSVSKAAVNKLTENLARELRPYGVTMLSYHPGLLELGLTKDGMDTYPTGDVWRDRSIEWFMAQRREGRFTDPEHSARTLLRFAAGEADHLSGHYLTPDSDLSVPSGLSDPSGSSDRPGHSDGRGALAAS
ncbi:SDR family NAD(P)-dependent oxidoreductase [Streptomyces sp. NPDC007901]|uniref:SDR family NAD(P)-dependent oxidoreductase n=1 Tax=Streptomyces sp. NPDC007901 TaxID=3364785 RepID=UPI0036E48931